MNLFNLIFQKLIFVLQEHRCDWVGLLISTAIAFQITCPVQTVDIMNENWVIAASTFNHKTDSVWNQNQCLALKKAVVVFVRRTAGIQLLFLTIVYDNSSNQLMFHIIIQFIVWVKCECARLVIIYANEILIFAYLPHLKLNQSKYKFSGKRNTTNNSTKSYFGGGSQLVDA